MDAWYYWSEGPHGMHDVPDPLSPEIRAIERNEFKSNAEGHWEGVKLFSRLDPKTLNDFMRVLTRWQVGPQFIVDSKERRLERNRFINKILAGDDPKKDAATVDVTFPLERGMDMDADTAREFLSQFEIGKTLTLPPCGYSMSPQQARQCASINIPRHGLENPEQLAVGLLLRVHSRGEISALKGDDYGEAGTIIGYPLSNKRRALNEYMEKHPEVEKGEFEASDRNYIVHHMDPYDDEAEVIRPGFAAQKVTKITKHVFPLRNEGDSRIMAARVLYVIDMTEQGIVDDPKQIAEVKSIITPIKKFYNYLNTTVARRRLKRELKKRGRSLSKVRSKRK